MMLSRKFCEVNKEEPTTPTPHSMITIEKDNSTYLKLSSDDKGSLLHVADFFTFDVPSARFMTKYRNKQWDGKIRLLKNNKLYHGLKTKLIEFLKEFKYPFRDTIPQPPTIITREELLEFITSLQLPFDVRDYQVDYALACINRMRVITVSPTSSGKSLIIFIVLAYLFKKKLIKRVLITVPTITLVNQLYQDFLSYCTYDAISSFFKTQTHCLFTGQDKSAFKPITISTWQSCLTFKKHRGWFQTFDCVVSDEIHLMAKDSGQFIFESCVNADYRLGFTGTLQETKLDCLVLEGLFGTPHKLVSTSELIEKQQVSQLKINNRVIKYSPEICQRVSKMSYQEEYVFLMTHPKRIELITSFVDSLDHNTLILFTRIHQQGDLLVRSLKERTKKTLLYITGATNAYEREEARKLMESRNDVVLIASYGTTSHGVSIQNIHHVVFASPYKSKIKVLQSIGRGLRLNENKIECVIHDFVDDARHNDRCNFLLNHFLERFMLYKQEHFKTRMVDAGMIC